MVLANNNEERGMHAWKCVTWGSPSHLERGTMPEPACGENQIEVLVKACGVNFADLLMISGRYQVKPELPFVPGMEVAGIVTAVGNGAETFSPGDRVAAYVKYGGYADRVVVPQHQAVQVPESIPWSQAAAFPLSYGSAELALSGAALARDEVILVGGAGGALGSACVELAKQRGAYVIACVGDSAKEEVARACGADSTVSSRSRSLTNDLQQAAPEGIDVVIDPVGGSFSDESIRGLRYGGRIVVLGFASGQIPSLRLNQLLIRHLSVIGSAFGVTCSRDPARISQGWPRLTELLVEGKIKPRVSKSLRFSELPRALQMLKERKVAGRLVLAE